MKKICLLTAIYLLCVMGLQAQRGAVEERIRLMRVAHITEAIDLSPEQSQAFWPLYNEYQDRQRTLRQDARPSVRVEHLTEAEAEQMLLRFVENEERRLQLDKEYIQKFRTVLSAKQIVQLYRAEKEFKRKLLERIRERRRRQ